jgi:hypothetical protein
VTTLKGTLTRQFIDKGLDQMVQTNAYHIMPQVIQHHVSKTVVTDENNSHIQLPEVNFNNVEKNAYIDNG